MATINSLTSSSSTSYGVTSKGIGGLATGLDTDELIKGMTIGTRSKIAKQLQNKQLFTWKTDAMRAVSTKLINFSQKYTSYTSNTNLTSRNFYMQNSITTSGTNADKVTVSGSSEITDGLSILSATKSVAGYVSADSVVSNKTFTGDSIDISRISELTDKQIGFSYNDTVKAITLTADDLAGVNTESDIAALLQTKLNDAFGVGKINVGTSVDGTSLQITTSEKTGGSLGILKVTSADTTVNEILGISAGDSNRLDLSMKASDLLGADAPLLSIGGTSIALTADSTVSDIISAVNNSNAGVKMTYVQSLDRFEFTSTDSGGEKAITGNIAASLLGTEATVISASTEASMTVKYKDGTEMTLSSSTDSFSLDGLTIKVNESFVAGDPVTMSSKANTDAVLSGIKDMIKDYNDIVDIVNKEYSTKPNRNYLPLTDELKEDMSESEIKAWDEKANTGMLFGDSDLASLSSDLRSVVLKDGDSILAFEAIGITSSSSWKDNGKLIIDEDKLRTAIENDPESVQKLFVGETDAAGVKISDGAADRLKTVMNSYVRTEGSPKGILIEKAGHPSSPLSIINNSLYTQIKDIDTFVLKLKVRLQSEQTRYQTQFTNLETVISNLNSQSGWLAQQFG